MKIYMYVELKIILRDYNIMDKASEILKVSDPNKVAERAYLIFGKKHGEIYLSSRVNKKYMIINPHTNKFVHFGDMRYEDYTKHKDINRRDRYRQRASKIKGDWMFDYFSPNNLSISLLW